MIKKAVDYKNMPDWASNYMNSIDLDGKSMTLFLNAMRAKWREEGLAHIIHVYNLPSEIREQIYFNKRGNLVFTWKSQAHKDMFIIKWSTI